MKFTLGRLTFKYEKLPKEIAILNGKIINLNNDDKSTEKRICEGQARFPNATEYKIHTGYNVYTIVWRDAGKFPWQVKNNDRKR